MVKLYMLWDMEGVSGLFERDQAWYWHPQVAPADGRGRAAAPDGRRQRGRRAALEAGADEVIVCDTHHGGGNIRIPELLADPRVTYSATPAWPAADGRRRYLPGLDETVDGSCSPGTTPRRAPRAPSCPTPAPWPGPTSGSTGRAWARSGWRPATPGTGASPWSSCRGTRPPAARRRRSSRASSPPAVKRAESARPCAGPAPGGGAPPDRRRGGARRWPGSGPGSPGPLPAPRCRWRSASAWPAPRTPTGRPSAPACGGWTSSRSEGVVERRCDVIKWITGTGLD